MLIARDILAAIKRRLLNFDKIIILYGARQTGKTTLVNQLIGQVSLKTLSISADERKYEDVLSSRNLNQLKALVSGYELLFVDEAQRVENIGINLKLLHDHMPDLRIIVTGSSSFDLANKVKEPLTGRTWTFVLFPIAVKELAHFKNNYELKDDLESLLIYGGYPDVFSLSNNDDKKVYLQELCSSYLYKDVLDLMLLKHPRKIYDLLRLLAFQIGSQVSVTELASSLKINHETVESYLNLMEKAFVIFRVSGFNRNLRKEVRKMDKIYFYDLGVRNTVIDNMKSFKYRDDIGKLWENFLMIERKKLLSYEGISAHQYFWRTYTGAELDYVEERDGELLGCEFKFKETKRQSKPPKTWLETYQNSKYKGIDRENFLEFII